MAPSQRLNPNLTRFVSTLPVPTLLYLLEAALASTGITNYQTDRDLVDSTWIASIRFLGRDRRSQGMGGRICISEGWLADEGEEDDDRGMQDDEGAKGTKGWDVVLWKKQADPLELKRLWAALVRALPGGVVFAT